MLHIDVVNGPKEIETVRDLLREYATSLAIDLAFQDFPAEVAGIPGSYAPRDGSLLLARVGNNAAAGCVAIRRLNAHVCEMKRLYVRPVHQGGGIGAQLVVAAIEQARSLGYQEMWLDTLPSMTSAHRLYVRLGFRQIAAYGSTHAAGTRFYGLQLVQRES